MVKKIKKFLCFILALTLLTATPAANTQAKQKKNRPEYSYGALLRYDRQFYLQSKYYLKKYELTKKALALYGSIKLYEKNGSFLSKHLSSKKRTFKISPKCKFQVETNTQKGTMKYVSFKTFKKYLKTAYKNKFAKADPEPGGNAPWGIVFNTKGREINSIELYVFHKF